MTKARSLRLASLLFTAAAFSAGLVALPSTASAERHRVRIGGDVRVRARGHVRIGGPRVHVGPRYRRSYRPYYRPHFRPRIHVRPYARPYVYYPGVYWGYRWGYRYAAPPPPACYEACGPSASAYYYAPPQPVAVAVVAPERERLPRLGIGVFGGSVDTENNEAGSDIGLVGRIRLTRHFMLEAEVAKSEFDDGSRIDRRLGGSVLFGFLPYSDLSPYVLAGGGFGQTDVDDGTFTADQAYGEVGIGLEWALGRHLSLFGDLRAGARASNADDEDVLLVRDSPGSPSVEDEERFTRARVGALLYF